MEEEPLLPPPPDNNEITISPSPLTPSSSSQNPTTSSAEDHDHQRFNLDHQISNHDLENQQHSWLTDHLPLYSSSRTNLHRSKSAPAMATINEINRFSPPRFVKPSIVRQGIMLLVLYLILGVIMYSLNRDSFKGPETHPLVDALYFCIVTMCTIGYGDITPNSTVTKLFSVAFVLVGFGFIDILLTGMLSYMLDLQENYLLRTIKGSYIIDVKKGRMRIRMKVALALGVVVLCVGIGVSFMHFVERLDWLDSFYLSVMSVTTVGYGDRVFNTLSGRVFASIWLLVSTLAVARAFLYLAEARVDKRHRRMAKWVLSQDMTVAQFLAADTDHNGFVSKPEYVIYMLKEMGKISEKDILVICKQFETLDGGNCGKISLADLMESHR